MASYNQINGVFASENRWLLTDVLRGEWGFTGAVVSDWDAVSDRVAALAAGLDLEMPGGDGSHDASRRCGPRRAAGEADRRRVPSARRRPRPTAVAATATMSTTTPTTSSLASSPQTAPFCCATNTGRSPSRPACAFAVIGEFAEQPRFQGGGSAHVNATRIDQPLDAIRDLALEHGVTVPTRAGFSIDGTEDQRLLWRSLSMPPAAPTSQSSSRG